MSIIKKIISLIRRIFGLKQKEKYFSVVEIDDIQNIKLKPNCLYIEKRGGKNRWLYLLCPSGCGETLSVNLMQSISPFWTLTRNTDNTATLSPSIDKTDGCKSHFFIRNSQIQWV